MCLQMGSGRCSQHLRMVAACLQLSGGGWRLLKNLEIVILGTWWLYFSVKMLISCLPFWRPTLLLVMGWTGSPLSSTRRHRRRTSLLLIKKRLNTYQVLSPMLSMWEHCWMNPSGGIMESCWPSL